MTTVQSSEAIEITAFLKNKSTHVLDSQANQLDPDTCQCLFLTLRHKSAEFAKLELDTID